MNHTHSKELRARRQEAKRNMVELKRIIKRMDGYLESSSATAVELASAFVQVCKFHIEEGDLNPHNVNLAALIRSQS